MLRYALQRAHLYAVSAANTVGRTMGLKGAAYLAEQNSNAVYINTFFATAPGGSLMDGAVFCGNTDGEVSLILTLRGDKDLAGGAAQWHDARRQLILKNTGIDVWAQTDVQSQCRAILAEISPGSAWSSYRHVLGLLQAATTIEAKVTVLVSKFEQSGSQARDVARRTALAQHWYDTLNARAAA